MVAAVVAMVITAGAGAWLTFAFQGTIVVAGALGVLQGLGRFDSGPSLSACCVAGTFFVAGFLGYYGAGGSIAFRALLSGDPGAFNPGQLPTWALLVDLGAAGVAGAASGLLALGRSPKESWRQLAVGVALGAPVLIGGAAAYKLHLVQRIGSMNMIAATILTVALFLVVVGLVSASAGSIIRAFSAGLPDLDALDAEPAADREPRTAKPAAKAASEAG